MIGINPGLNGYRGDQFGVDTADLIDYGYTAEVGYCPSLTEDTGGEFRRTT